LISEGSCDTEDWSDDAENVALPSFLCIRKLFKRIFHNITGFTIFLFK